MQTWVPPDTRFPVCCYIPQTKDSRSPVIPPEHFFCSFKQNQACIQHVFRHNAVEKVQRDKHMNGAWVAIIRLSKKGNFTHLRRKKMWKSKRMFTVAAKNLIES